MPLTNWMTISRQASLALKQKAQVLEDKRIVKGWRLWTHDAYELLASLGPKALALHADGTARALVRGACARRKRTTALPPDSTQLLPLAGLAPPPAVGLNGLGVTQAFGGRSGQ